MPGLLHSPCSKLIIDMKNKLIFCILILIYSSAAAQTDRLGIVAKTEKKQIVLRWMPQDYDVFKQGITEGYTLSRKTIKRNGLPVAEETAVLTQQPLKPLKDSFWEQEGKKDRFAYVVQQLLKAEDPNDQEAKDLNLSLAMLMSTTSATIADALGMLYYDKAIIDNEEYEYTVSCGSLTATVNAKGGELTRIAPPDSLYADFADSTVFIRWRVADSLMHSAFLVERSDDGGVKFAPVNTEPILITNDADSLGNLYASYSVKLPKFHYKYAFRIRAYTPFGQLTGPSAKVEVMGYRDRLPQPVVKHSLIPHKGIRLEWDFPDYLQNDIRGFEILVSDTPDGKFEYLLKNTLPRKTRSYEDTLTRADAYYKVAAVNLAGGLASSIAEFVQTDDTTAPAKPLWVIHRVSKQGVVRLKWKMNTERDLYGYSIYRADNPKAEFSIITPEMIRDSVYHDTLALNVLNKKVYYTLVAYDHRLNASIHADTLVVMRPDTIPPTPPIFGEFVLSDSTIQFSWHPSSSIDVSKTRLLRSGGGADSLELAVYPAAVQGWQQYTDTTAAEKTEYIYTLQAIDEGGLYSEPSHITLEKLWTGVRPAIEPLSFEYDPQSRNITLRWPLPARKVKRYTLYRRGPQDTYLSVYRVFEGQYGNFLEKNVEKNKPYLYAIQAIYEDGSTSKLGEPFRAILE